MIIGILGGMGSGKTLLLSKLLRDDLKVKKKIYSNYKLAFKHQILETEDIYKYAEQEEELSNLSIGLDEIYLYVDSRLSSQKKNRIYSYFLLQTNKRDVNLYYTAQRLNTVDKRFRENTGLFINCVPFIFNNKKMYYAQNNKTRLLPKDLQDKLYILLIYTEVKSFGLQERTVETKKIIKASNFYHLYDTREIIKLPK